MATDMETPEPHGIPTLKEEEMRRVLLFLSYPFTKTNALSCLGYFYYKPVSVIVPNLLRSIAVIRHSVILHDFLEFYTTD